MINISRKKVYTIKKLRVLSDFINDVVVLIRGIERKGRIAFTIEFKISFFF